MSGDTSEFIEAELQRLSARIARARGEDLDGQEPQHRPPARGSAARTRTSTSGWCRTSATRSASSRSRRATRPSIASRCWWAARTSCKWQNDDTPEKRLEQMRLAAERSAVARLDRQAPRRDPLPAGDRPARGRRSRTRARRTSRSRSRRRTRRAEQQRAGLRAGSARSELERLQGAAEGRRRAGWPRRPRSPSSSPPTSASTSTCSTAISSTAASGSRRAWRRTWSAARRARSSACSRLRSRRPSPPRRTGR